MQFKIRVRGIPEAMPERIYWESKQRYYNHHSLRHIAVMDTYYHRRRTLMMIAYDQFAEHVEILTIHPITRKQIRDRSRTERWTDE
ncbi:MAG: hypothetical protein HY258_10755 [Chloroflexi bacterium]|nr:hypothetical protein [Chloroflexota bacterium]